MTDAQARASFNDRLSTPNHVRMFEIAGALDRAGEQLSGGLETRLAAAVLTLWPRKTWRSAARDEPVADYPYQPDNVDVAARRTLRGRLAIDIADGDEAPLRSFAATLAPPLIRARFFDVLWERFRKASDAAEAIDASLMYASEAEDDSWPDVDAALGRAALLVLGRKDESRVPSLLSAFETAATTVLAGRFDFAFACLADTFVMTVLGARWLREQVPQETFVRWSFTLASLGERFFGVDAHYGQTCFLVLAEWSSRLRAQSRAEDARRRLVEHLLACARGGSGVVGSTHASSALNQALRFGFADLVERAKTTVQEQVLASHSEMKRHEFSFALPPEVVAQIDSIVDAAPSAAAAVRDLGALIGLCEVPVEAMRRAAAAQISQSVFISIIPSMHTRGGKVSFVANGPEAKLQEATARNVDAHLALVEHLLWRALQRLSARVEPSTMVRAMVGVTWLPQATHAWLERASERFHAGDMMSSGIIVAMQYEAILRELARSRGASGLKTDGDGTLMDETLGSLFRQDLLRDLLGEDHLFFVEYVLGNPALGPNLRNELAHGNAPPWHLTAPRVLLLWLFAVRLTFFGAPITVLHRPKEEDIAIAAYYRWLEGGRENGLDLEDWLLAEDDLGRGLS